MKLEFSRQVFEKYSNIRFHENPFSGSRVVPCGQRDMKKLVVAFRERALQRMLELCKTDLRSTVQIKGKYIIKFIIWMQKTIVESQLRFQGFAPAFCGCLCPYGWVSIVTGLGRCCYYLHDRHVFPNTVFLWPVRRECFIMRCYYLHDASVS